MECNFDGVTIKPDGEHELVACQFEKEQVLKNVTVEILRCPKCGKISYGWYRQPNTEDITERENNDKT